MFASRDKWAFPYVCVLQRTYDLDAGIQINPAPTKAAADVLWNADIFPEVNFASGYRWSSVANFATNAMPYV